MATFRIPFELRPLAEVTPWGSGLHWFGLTDGWYDLVVAGERLLSPCNDDEQGRGVSYPVVRMWEAVITILPDVLDPIPAALAMRLADAERWSDWVERAWLGEHDDVVVPALTWWWARALDFGYLRGAPRPHLWRHGDDVRIRWRSLPRTPDEPEWSSPTGDAIVPVAALRDEIVQFDGALIAAMQARVAAVSAGGLRPDIEIDVDALCREHTERATFLVRTLSAPRPAEYAWDEVLAAVATLEERIGAAIG